MANVYELMPEIMGEEQIFVASIIKNFDDQKAQQFANVYRTRRRDPQTILLLTLVGFLGIAGIQRFITDRMGLGILYLLTGGICMIGTIIDLINYKKIAFEYNQKQAMEIAAMIRAV
ncbi:TM2 domain-containing protein [Melioribacter roseus P3M-2]|jgi:TM2 domain-containing membrane protein YozV|uniref:TM2 domain-containing protein n=1 Tax=Melioribacter roseus (strain DSM 23840 / JCM 17771 / VKM B-2668 / P3M-2) TaxID=1191523 RepID=I6YVJ7_MELRP|nr:TM2 domain-containing protein [Melioribacter roseus]AFN74582.1 TM2 domain-containing protein [Melioribacter roseus P3M-2]